uniref:uncharacterized protein LOC118547690 isoform X2 n=1 Tax=Halichoerus grypus TaxID=9711 RepID=UPI001659A238|nr:uncharacterized protein LOC118547690 isoform X2 [Halichoerus grypus]
MFQNMLQKTWNPLTLARCSLLHQPLVAGEGTETGPSPVASPSQNQSTVARGRVKAAACEVAAGMGGGGSSQKEGGTRQKRNRLRGGGEQELGPGASGFGHGMVCPVTRAPRLPATAAGPDRFHQLRRGSPVFPAELREGGRGAGLPVDTAGRQGDSGLSGIRISHNHCQPSLLPSSREVTGSPLARRTGGLLVGAPQANNLCFLSGLALAWCLCASHRRGVAVRCSEARACSSAGDTLRLRCSRQRRGPRTQRVRSRWAGSLLRCPSPWAFSPTGD